MRYIPKRYTRKRFTEEQLNRANNIDLADMLRTQGEKLKKEGRVHRWMRYDSNTIYGNKWFRHSRRVGGGPIQFIQTNETAVEYEEGNYIGNKNSKKFHRPDCHTLPAEKNRV